MSFQNFSDTYIPQIDAYMREQLTFKFTDQRSILEDAILYSATNPAKRIRPLLCIATAKLFKQSISSILPLAAAFEMIHAYSLIHDDLPAMDDDDLRRGKPTCHVQFGEDVAILAGDSLNTFAFELLAAELPKFYSAESVVSCIQKFSHACGIFGMAGGQVLDLRNDASQQNLSELETIHRLKTGAIIHACLELPGILSNVSKSDLKVLSHVGQQLGLLFQIVDDILDVKSDSDTLGKTAGKDLEQNKCTYVSFWGLEKAETIARDTLEDIQSKMAHFKSKDFDPTAMDDVISFIYQREY